jgi:hypothetical protein
VAGSGVIGKRNIWSRKPLGTVIHYSIFAPVCNRFPAVSCQHIHTSPVARRVEHPDDTEWKRTLNYSNIASDAPHSSLNLEVNYE